jgi:phage gp36-like protein
MADLQSKMSAHQQDIDRAKEQIHDTTQKADSYLTDVRTLTLPTVEFAVEHGPNLRCSLIVRVADEARRGLREEALGLRPCRPVPQVGSGCLSLGDAEAEDSGPGPVGAIGSGGHRRHARSS